MSAIETFLPKTNRIIVIGDLHGDTAMLCSCLYLAKIINTNMEWIANPPNTIVVQIGDQLDSLVRTGVPDDWEKLDDTMLMRFTDKLDSIARLKGGRFISMLGNHEIMNVFGDYSYVSSNSMEKSGGVEGRNAKFRPNGLYAELLAKRPSVLKIGDILFCHAGILPHHLYLLPSTNTIYQNLQYINDLNVRVILGKSITPQEMYIHKELFVNQTSLLWNRAYIENSTTMGDMLNRVLELTNSSRMVIGHNPIEHITALYDGKLWITDVGLSRSFPSQNMEILEIINGNIFNIIRASQ